MLFDVLSNPAYRSSLRDPGAELEAGRTINSPPPPKHVVKKTKGPAGRMSICILKNYRRQIIYLTWMWPILIFSAKRI